MQDPERTTLDYLQQLGFSSQMIDSFLRPFLGGIFLDAELNTSSRMLNFVFRMFSIGDACLPAHGMQALPELLARPIPFERIRLNTSVEKIDPGVVTLQDGQQLQASSIVVAVDGPAAKRLLPGVGHSEGRSVRCLYYSATQPPFPEPILVLNGDGQGPINNLCVPTNVSADYAPAGQALISVTVLGHDAAEPESVLEGKVRALLSEWYGAQVEAWRHLRTYSIAYALPISPPLPCVSRSGQFVTATASIYAATIAITLRSKAPWSPAAAPPKLSPRKIFASSQSRQCKSGCQFSSSPWLRASVVSSCSACPIQRMK